MVEETGNWTPQELAAVLRKWEHVGPRLCGRAADMIEAQAALLQECCSSFEAQNARLRELIEQSPKPISFSAMSDSSSLSSFLKQVSDWQDKACSALEKKASSKTGIADYMDQFNTAEEAYGGHVAESRSSSLAAQNARVREALGAKVREIGKGRDDNDWRPDPATVEYIASYLEARQ